MGFGDASATCARPGADAVELAARATCCQRAPGAVAGHARLVGAGGAGAAEARRDPSSTPRAARWSITRRSRRRCATRGLRVGLDVFANEPDTATGDVPRSARCAARRLRHAPHRRLDRPGAGSDRRRDRPHRPRPSRRPAGAERRQPGEADAGDAHAGRPAPRSARRARPRVRPPARSERSTCRRPRTSSSRARTPPSPASTSTARPTPRCSTACGGNADILDLQLVPL